MAEALFIAAGGGGDAIAAAMLARAMGMEREDAIIATLAWERLMVDPVPGPRSPRDFEGLSPLGRQNFEVLSSSRPKSAGTSCLPRLAEELGHRLAILDPSRGAVGLAEQVDDLASLLYGDRAVVLVDVGGDVLADGSESGLRSPLADGLMLAAVARVDKSAQLLVAGPGLDGELAPKEVEVKLRVRNATPHLTLGRVDAEPAIRILEWHPSEATALLAATAKGLRGIAEIRDAGTQIQLASSGAQTWALPISSAIEHTLGQRLLDTPSLASAEDALVDAVGWTEVDYERAKAKQGAVHTAPHTNVDDALWRSVRAFESSAAARGTVFVTFRRIAESIGLPRRHKELRTWLVNRSPAHECPPLWRVT